MIYCMAQQTNRVAVVGTGNVGSTFAYALLLSGLASEIVLIDANRARAEGEAMDLNHTEPFAQPTRIWAGDYADCVGAAVTVVAAGGSGDDTIASLAGQLPGQRLVVTADRELRHRCEAAGAAVTGPRWLLSLF